MSGPTTTPRIAPTQFLRDLAAASRDVFYPPACASCRGAVNDREQRLCNPCRTAIIPHIAQRCARCSAPVGPHLDTSAGCIHCQDERWKLGRVYSLGVYSDNLREACLRIKQPASEPLVAALAEQLAATWHSQLQAAAYDLIIPVPHHWRQRLWRTQLPPITLARTLSRSLGVPLDHCIVRKTKFTPLQATLTAAERRSNLHDAFAPARGLHLSGGRILVVDDVLTTGTTADRVARVLLNLGAESVDAAVIARGLGHQ